jgi:UDP-glucuronate decarboxylase
MKKVNKNRILDEDIAVLAKIFGTPEYKKQFEGKTFLITGAGGFLGKYMVLLLKHMNEKVLKKPLKAILLDNYVTGYDSNIASDNNITFVKHNVINPFKTDAHIDYLIHAAGIASPVYYTRFPIETMDVGTLGTRNMLELAKEKNVKSFLFTSSSEVYGDPDSRFVPTPETYYGNVSILGPRACYDESKRFGETMCITFHRTYDIPTKIVRPFNVYGPGIRPDDYRVLPNFIEHALRKEPLPVHGDGKNTRSYCYVNDAIEMIFKILFSNANGESFNIGNPSQEISVHELAKVVASLMSHKVEIKVTKPPFAVYANSDPKRRCPDISKLQSVVKFKPKYDLKTGLSRTIEWYQENYIPTVTPEATKTVTKKTTKKK